MRDPRIGIVGKGWVGLLIVRVRLPALRADADVLGHATETAQGGQAVNGDRPRRLARQGRPSRLESGGGPGELVGGMAHVHAGIVQHEVANIDQVAVEDQGADRFSHVAARLPTRGQAGGLQPGIEAQDSDGDRLEPAGDPLPRQLRQIVGAGDQPLLVKLPSPALESHACTLKLSY